MICSYATPREACLAHHLLITRDGLLRYFCDKHLNVYLDRIDEVQDHSPNPLVHEPRALMLNSSHLWT